MKKRTRVFLIILAVIIAAIAALAVWQRNNISAVIMTLSKTEEEIASELDSTKKVLENELGDKYATVIGDFTAEEERMIIKGELSVEEAVGNLTQRYEEKKNTSAVSGNKTVTGDNSAEVDKLIGDKAIELYSLKAYYLGQLGQMEATVKKEYIALPKEKQNLIGKQEIVSKHMGTALSLLKQCDSQVDALLADLEKSLKSLNADTSIIKVIRDTYENEKALKKAYYLKLMEG